MSKNTSKSKDTQPIPLQVKPRSETREKLKIIAEKNGLSLNDVANLALAAGIGMVEEKLGSLNDPKAKAA